MITIKVVAFNGQAPLQSLSAEFDELGGSIGRGEGNTLVLPDPDRHISRTHAAILFQGGRYVVQDKGTATPVKVNGAPLGQGRESPIGEGDELTIGGYTLRVAAAVRLDNHATQFGKTPLPASGPSKDDPLAMFGAGASSGGSDPFADLLSPAGGAKPSASAAPSLMDDPFAAPQPKGGGHAGAIPADFDPFADLSSPSAVPPITAKLPDDFDLGLGSSGANQNIDQLFGLGSTSNADPLGPGGPLSAPFGGAGASQNVDPLAAFSGVPPVTASRIPEPPPQRNDTPELNAHFQPPVAKPDPLMAKPTPLPEPGPLSSSPNMVLSWDDHNTASGEIKTIIINPRRREQEEVAPLPTPPRENDAAPKASAPAPNASADPLAMFGGPASSAADPLGLKQPEASATTAPRIAKPPVDTVTKPPPSPVTIPQTPVAPQATVASRPAAAPAGQDDLLRAFLVGAGIPNLQIPGGLTPETMQMLGTVLREATQGTIDLLLARAMIKREVRAEVTMIVARENNPLKFSPNVEAALSQLLAPQARGFMPPIKAMKDAYNDLRSHQFGFMAGMRAALAGVLKRFNPEQLEQRISQKRVIDSLLPMNRKAKLWDMFEDLYGDISKEAEDDFHALFGKEFVRAYEAQIEKLEREEKDQ